VAYQNPDSYSASGIISQDGTMSTKTTLPSKHDSLVTFKVSISLLSVPDTVCRT